MNYQYSIEYGSYYLYDLDAQPNIITKEKTIILMCDEVSLCFDKENWTLHKHGRLENVQKWYDTNREKLLNAGLDDWANNLIVVTGAFPVDELNKCLSTTGYIQFFCEKLFSNKLESSKKLNNHI